MSAVARTFGCLCGRVFRSKSARTRHANRCATWAEYRDRVRALG